MVHPGAPVPDLLEHPRFVATPLTVALAALDHAAYTSSPEVIGVHSDGRWPLDGFTLAEDRDLIARHEVDHRERRAFTYALLTASRETALGCLYLNPFRGFLQRAGAPDDLVERTLSTCAMVTFWLRQDEQETDLADHVVGTVDGWLRDQWPLDGYVVRILPGEVSSRAALERAGLRQVDLGPFVDDRRPYLWYRCTGPVHDWHGGTWVDSHTGC